MRSKTTPGPKRALGQRIVASAKRVFFGVASMLIVWALLEGTSSTLLFVWDYLRNSQGALAETTHTRHDELLGWVNIENAAIENLYGEGIGLRTNSRGFRADRDYDVSPPPGKLRLICSGDSFTLGYGVDNQHTWCELLTGIDERLETVNMGQGGYGIDQAYLWYEREGSLLDHDVHVFSFINADFWRMRQRSFHGYSKPLLKIANEELVVENLPVPQRTFAPWISRNRPILERLRIVQLLRAALPTRAEEKGPNDAELREVLLKIIEELHATNQSKQSLLAVVFLPTQADYSSNDSGGLRRFLRRELKERELVFVDLVRELRTIPPEDVDSLFIPREPTSRKYAYAGGHYSVKGNAYIARTLYQTLMQVPDFSSNLTKSSVRAGVE